MREAVDDFYTVQDFEVFGVGARRRRELEAHPRVRLIRHPWSFLPGVDGDTLKWLRPAEIRQEPMPERQLWLRKKFVQIFPRGVGLLGDLQSKILADYLGEMPWQEGLLDDHFRYFGLFLKRRFPRREAWSEVFQAEWVRWSRLYEDHSWAGGTSAGFEIAPSFQAFSLGTEAAAALSREPGLFACAYDESVGDIRELKLDPLKARFLDCVENEAGLDRDRVRAILCEEGFSVEQVSQAEAALSAGFIR